MFKRSFLLTGLAFLAASPAIAQPSAGDAIVRVVDIGPGLCVVAAVPGGHGMVFDAGPRGATRCTAAVRELIPGRRLDLFVLSHSDIDHIGMVGAILGRRPAPHQTEPENLATVILHPGDPRGSMVTTMRQTLTDQATLGACVYDLRANNQPPAPCRRPPAGRAAVIAPGDSFAVGAARATFVAGWGDGNLTVGPHDAPLPNAAALNNVLSIVIRFEYGGHSVLITGDTLGRAQGNPASVCSYAERIMAGNAAAVPIDSDVLIGQHHGADNSTSTCFIRAVSPRFVIFSAGHEFNHPREATVQRLVANGVALANIFRTDLGDNEGGTEMVAGSGRCADPRGDDDVEIRLPRNPGAAVTVAYTGVSARCGP
jgi:beta-lactamase superfamily II metal-dependent hydrolase